MTRSVGRDFSLVNVRTRTQSEKTGLAQYGQDFRFSQSTVVIPSSRETLGTLGSKDGISRNTEKSFFFCVDRC